ncbi:MAG: YqgE/AlgH family protein [Proteobacteria bacterium]|nr:YqgE/AlgH family protein [Pseudomonadota bacterium]
MTPHSTSSKNRRILKRWALIALAAMLILLAPVADMVLMNTAFSSHPSELPSSEGPVILQISDQARPPMELSKGKFLVASKQLRDPQFFETVVLLIQYNTQGAMGLVINRPTTVKLSKVLPEIEGLQKRSDTIYLGGPVAKNQLMLLIRTNSPPEGSRLVFKDIYLSSSQTIIEKMIDNPDTPEKFRVYAGYAGWAPGQLDQEVSRGGWHILQADEESVFDKTPLKIWPELIRRSSALWVRVVGE